jgi:hypothetical protein
MTDRLLHYLARLADDEIRDNPSADGIADILWMARHLTRPQGPAGGTAAPQPRERLSPAPGTARTGSDPADSARRAGTELHPFSARRGVPGPGQRHATALRIPAAAAIDNSLEISRALRPLKRQVARPRDVMLAEEETATVFGETGLMIPVWQSARERWLQLDLVVDTSQSMALWQRTAAELLALLEHHGAFRNVRAWALDSDSPAPRLTPLTRSSRGRAAIARSPAELVDHAGRRAVLVFTDAVSSGWSDGTLAPHLLTWARACPLAIVEALPRRLWDRTALRVLPVAGRNLPRAKPPLRVTHTGSSRAGHPESRAAAWLPVLHLSAEWLRPWAAMVAGTSEKPTSMFAVPLYAGAARPAAQPAGDAALPAVDQLRAFEQVTASPEALELAGYLAAAPLTLPVMRLVQQAMLPESGPDHLAEVFLSGLLVRDSPGADDDDPDAVLYDFREGVRQRLLSRITRRDSLRVLNVLGRVPGTFARRLGSLDFRALASLASAGPNMLPVESLPFARIAADVLQGLGGSYTDLARILSNGAYGTHSTEAAASEASSTPREIAADPAARKTPPSGADAPLLRSDTARGQQPRNDSAGQDLKQEPAAPAGRTSPAAATRTLPRDISSFTGRRRELQTLTDAASASGGAVGVCAIGGMAGVGKTAFAVHAAHQLAGLFPDGQIFLPLHGNMPGLRPVDPGDALASLLLTVGVTPQQVPAGLEERVAMWRDKTAGKRLLLVLDDAASSEQVRPLLPGTSASLVLITSRRHLAALEDVLMLSLNIPSPSEAAELLVQLADRVDLSADDAAVVQITRLCGHLPLAVGIVARQLHHHPDRSAADLAADLTAARDRLELMTTENLSLSAVFDLSYVDLTAGQQQLFRRLGLHPGSDFDDYAAAALDGTDLATARRALDGLSDRYLVDQQVPRRYRMHDLIREHARALAARLDADDDREQATTRLLSGCWTITSTPPPAPTPSSPARPALSPPRQTA